jgi:hypothetical protein
LDFLQKNPERSLSVSASWGVFIERMPYLEKELKEVFLAAAKIPYKFFNNYYDELSPFNINLSDEADFLPFLLVPILHGALDRRSGIYRRERDGETNSLNRAVQQIKSCGIEREPLLVIMNDIGHTEQVRAAAHVMALLLDEKRADLTTADLAALGARYSLDLVPWFLAAVGLVTNDAIEAGREDAKIEFGKVLQEARSDYSSRIVIDPLIERWREITRTPVLKSPRDIWI